MSRKQNIALSIILTLAATLRAQTSEPRDETLTKNSVDQALDHYALIKTKPDAPDALVAALKAYVNLEFRLTRPFQTASSKAAQFMAASGRSVSVGAPAAVGAGTSLVSSGLITSLISGAMESGALQKDTAGTVNTFRVNALAAWALANNEIPRVCDALLVKCPVDLGNPLAGLSFAVSFDSSRKDQAVVAAADALFLRAKRTLSSAQIRYDLYRRRLKTSDVFKSEWGKAVTLLSSNPATGEYLTELSKHSGLQLKLDGLTDEKLGTIATKLNANNDFVIADRPKQREMLRTAARDGVLNEVKKIPDGDKLMTALDNYERERDKILTGVIWSKSLSAEFTHQRPIDEPSYGNGRLVIATPIGRQSSTAPLSELTFNLGANMFYTPPKLQPTRHLRDIQASLQLTRRLKGWSAVNGPLLAVSGYYQYLTDNAVLELNGEQISQQTGLTIPTNASALLKDTKGSIYIGQIKLTFPVGKSGISFPIAISTSNRTELLKTKGTDVRGNFGILFDLDTLISNLKQ